MSNPRCILVALVLAGVLPAAAASAQVEPGFVPVYTLNIPTAAQYNNTGVTYALDNHALIADGSFTRVAYLMTVGGSTNSNDRNGYVYTSFDTYTNTAANLGVPTNFSNSNPLQQNLTNMNVATSLASGVTAGTGLTGNIEFWNSNYTQARAPASPANASDSTFDFGDSATGGGYGSMQIHNSGAGQTLFAYNNWGSNGGTSDIGLGNQPSNQPDWTFANNAGDYTTRTLQIYVNPEPASLGLLSVGAMGLLARRRRQA